MSASALRRLRALALARSLFAPTTLSAAVERLGFVQADPIRAPARAQDLILRHRVREYRAGDLERRYPRLAMEEDLLYAYGFLPRGVWRLLHPRPPGTGGSRLSTLDARVLEAVRQGGVLHPRELDAQVGRGRVLNAWGGYSKAATRALERLHRRGLLRVARREAGVRLYEALPAHEDALPPAERLAALTLTIAALLAPVPERTLTSIASRLRRGLAGARDHRAVLRGLLRAGALERLELDGVAYLWPPASRGEEAADADPPREVRLLAPFDPLVWDRTRFEQFWGWAYRFEAYTPAAKRLRGYYALPLLWGEAVIGWANAAVVEGTLRVEPGYVVRPPRERAFRQSLEAEVARMAAFLDCRAP